MRRPLLFPLLLLLLAGLACSLSNDPQPTATFPPFNTPTLVAEAAATAVLPTATAVPPSATPAATATEPPPTATEPPPTATEPPATATATATIAQPTATATIAATVEAPTERIVVAAGETGATVTGQVGAVESDRFVLWALANQFMTVNVESGQAATMLLSIYGTDGTLLKRDAVGGPSWSGTLPATQDYVIAVRTAGEVPASYALTVDITPLTAAPTPERITFAPGATAATVAGTLAQQGDVKQYVLRALAGQRMVIQVNSGQPGIVLTSLRKEGGETLGISADPAPVVAFLPETGDYLITLTTHNIAPAVAYSLLVEVTSPSGLPEPERIVFAPGAVSAAVRGTVPSGGSERYILRALAGQTMTLVADTEPAGAMSIVIATADGHYLTAGTDNAPFSLALPATGDYLITLTTPAAAPPVTYELVVDIE